MEYGKRLVEDAGGVGGEAGLVTDRRIEYISLNSSVCQLCCSMVADAGGVGGVGGEAWTVTSFRQPCCSMVADAGGVGGELR